MQAGETESESENKSRLRVRVRLDFQLQVQVKTWLLSWIETESAVDSTLIESWVNWRLTQSTFKSQVSQSVNVSSTQVDWFDDNHFIDLSWLLMLALLPYFYLVTSLVTR